MYSRYLTIDAVSTIVENKITEGTIEPGEGARIIDVAKAGSSKSMRSASEIEKAALTQLKYDKNDKIRGSRINSKGETVFFNQIDPNSVSRIKFNKDLRSLFEDYPYLAPYFRAGLTGTDGGNYYGKVPNWDLIFSDFPSKLEISRKKYAPGTILNKKAIEGLDLKNIVKLKVLKQMFLDIETFLNKEVEGVLVNKDKAYLFKEFVRNAPVSQNHPLRFLAPFGFYSIDPVSGKMSLLPNTEEHSLPAIQIGRMLLAAAKTGNVEQVFKVVEKSYMQGGLLRSNDLNLKDFNLQHNMPDIFWDKTVQAILDGKLDFLPNGFASIIRYTANDLSLIHI